MDMTNGSSTVPAFTGLAMGISIFNHRMLSGVENGEKATKIPILFVHDNSDVGMGDGGIEKW